MKNCTFGTAPEGGVSGSQAPGGGRSHMHMPSPVWKPDGDLTKATVTLLRITWPLRESRLNPTCLCALLCVCHPMWQKPGREPEDD